MAIAAYKNQKVKSILHAAEIYEVPEPSLRARIKGRKPRSETRTNSHKLSVLEEDVLAKRLVDADKRGFSIRPEFLRGMAQILLSERTKDSLQTLGLNWASKFVKRHPALRTRSSGYGVGERKPRPRYVLKTVDNSAHFVLFELGNKHLGKQTM